MCYYYHACYTVCFPRKIVAPYIYCQRFATSNTRGVQEDRYVFRTDGDGLRQLKSYPIPFEYRLCSTNAIGAITTIGHDNAHRIDLAFFLESWVSAEVIELQIELLKRGVSGAVLRGIGYMIPLPSHALQYPAIAFIYDVFLVSGWR